jgi:membrane protease YdiL (CAAX protease family)
VKRILAVVAIFLFWNVSIVIPIFLLPAPSGVVVSLLFSGWVLHHFILRAGQPGEARRRATLRIRPLQGEVLGWTLLFIPAVLAVSWTLGEVYTGLVPVPPSTLDPFGQLIDTPMGRLSAMVLAVGVAPVLEEFVFRGLLQRPLERRWGPIWGITVTAAVFALAHMLPWVFPLHFALGAAFGFAVYATRSIWAGVLLHAANNTLAVLGLFGEKPVLSTPTIWQTGPTPTWWAAVALLLPATLAAVWVGRRMLRAGRRRPTGRHFATSDLLIPHAPR